MKVRIGSVWLFGPFFSVVVALRSCCSLNLKRSFPSFLFQVSQNRESGPYICWQGVHWKFQDLDPFSQLPGIVVADEEFQKCFLKIGGILETLEDQLLPGIVVDRVLNVASIDQVFEVLVVAVGYDARTNFWIYLVGSDESGG